MNGVELEDREFISAIREGREPNSSVAQCLPTMRVMGQLEKTFLSDAPPAKLKAAS
jgi:2-hydroxy-4-carboxymuconate semialdehyde hemiacetal dehydrogenase